MTVSYGAVEPKSMVINWTPLAQANNGGDAITFYGLEVYDSNSNTWNQLNFDYGNVYTTFTHTSASNF